MSENSSPKTSLLTKRFPWAYDPDETVAFTPMGIDLLPFLGTRDLKPTHWPIIIALYQLTDFSGRHTTVTISDASLAQRAGVHQGRVSEAVKDPEFLAIIGVDRGEPTSKGRKGSPTTYDLANLYRGMRETRRLEQPAKVEIGWHSSVWANMYLLAARMATVRGANGKVVDDYVEQAQLIFRSADLRDEQQAGYMREYMRCTVDEAVGYLLEYFFGDRLAG